MKLKSQYLLFPIKIAIGAGLIWYLIQKGLFDPAQVLEITKNPITIISCAVFGLGLLIFNNLRWTILLRAVGFKVKNRDTFVLNLASGFFSFFLPGSVGGDVFKVLVVTKNSGTRKLVAGLSVFMDRLVGTVAVFILATAAILYRFKQLHADPQLRFFVYMVLGVTLAIFVGGIWYFRSGRSNHAPKGTGGNSEGWFIKAWYKIQEAALVFSKRPRSFVWALLCSVGAQSCMVGIFVAVSMHMGLQNISWDCYLFVIPLGLLAIAVPLTPVGVGTGQLAFAFFMNQYLGYETNLGPAAFTVFQVVVFSWDGLGAAVYFLGTSKLRMQQQPV